MKLHKISKSVRVPRSFQRKLGHEVVRLSLNPVLYKRSETIVRWSRTSPGFHPAVLVIQEALKRYPQLSLSSAVEMVLVDLLVQQLNPLTDEERRQSERFRGLSLMQQIRVTQKRLRTARYLKSLV